MVSPYRNCSGMAEAGRGSPSIPSGPRAPAYGSEFAPSESKFAPFESKFTPSESEVAPSESEFAPFESEFAPLRANSPSLRANSAIQNIKQRCFSKRDSAHGDTARRHSGAEGVLHKQRECYTHPAQGKGVTARRHIEAEGVLPVPRTGEGCYGEAAHRSGGVLHE
eukprot:1190869-Prorocentrum_minimum.AAC.1